ncbi:hypothetical protein [Deinococcus yunweiensis]|uniref:hypothetical protein n=1 Tax=Deinococcus yunweiensis TaxID=367282 RepID=UPI00398EAF23
METHRGRVQCGGSYLSATLILRTPRGVEGSMVFDPMPRPYMFPHLRTDVEVAAVTAFLSELLAHVRITPERPLVLDSVRADVSAEPVLEAGWVLDDHALHYETDLAPGSFTPDLHASEGNATYLERADIRDVLEVLGRSDLDLTHGFQAGWTLVALEDDGAPVALGAYGPAKPG